MFDGCVYGGPRVDHCILVSFIYDFLQDSPERGKELKFKGLGSARERLWCGCGCEEEDVVIARGVEDQRTRGEEENEVAIDGDDWMERGRMAEEEEVVEQWILWQRCKIYY